MAGSGSAVPWSHSVIEHQSTSYAVGALGFECHPCRVRETHHLPAGQGIGAFHAPYHSGPNLPLKPTRVIRTVIRHDSPESVYPAPSRLCPKSVLGFCCAPGSVRRGTPEGVDGGGLAW